MTVMQYLSTFRLYSAEVLLIALGVTLVTSLLKKTLLKNFQSKLYVFLPFALGLAFYAVFRLIVTASLVPLTEELCATFEGGFACGCASTLYYVVWEQFFRRRGEEEISPVYPLLEGFVEDERREEAAKKLYEGGAALEEAELEAFVRETLNGYVSDNVTEEELTALCMLVKELLLSLRTDE